MAATYARRHREGAPRRPSAVGRLSYRTYTQSRYPAIAAYDGESRLGHIDFCQGRFHLVVEGTGYLGVYASEIAAKRALRYYLRQVREGANRPVAPGV